jgi:hypothetical protein
MSEQDTTIQARAAGLSLPDEMQGAQNRFAVAVKNHLADPSPANLKELEDAQDALYAIEDLYREGRRLLLVHAWSHQQRLP